VLTVTRQPGNFLPIPASYFTGQDLTAIELAQSSEGVIPMLAPLDPSTILSDEPASMGDGNATGGANESDSNTASSSGMDGDSSKDEAAVHHPSEDQGGTPKESSGPDTTNTSMTLKGDNGEVVHVNFGCNGCGVSGLIRSSRSSRVTVCCRSPRSWARVIIASIRPARTPTFARSVWMQTGTPNSMLY
jgi:hypothetical protein